MQVSHCISLFFLAGWPHFDMNFEVFGGVLGGNKSNVNEIQRWTRMDGQTNTPLPIKTTKNTETMSSTSSLRIAGTDAGPALRVFPYPAFPAPVAAAATTTTTNNNNVTANALTFGTAVARLCTLTADGAPGAVGCGPASPTAAAAYSACLVSRCSEPLGRLRTSDGSDSAAGFLPPTPPPVTSTGAADVDAASVELCGLRECAAQFQSMASTLCVALDSPAFLNRGIYLPSLPTAEGPPPPPATAAFARYTSAVQHTMLVAGASGQGVDPVAFAAAASASAFAGGKTAAPERLGICAPTLPYGYACSPSAIDATTNLMSPAAALGAATTALAPATMGKSAVVVLSASPLTNSTDTESGGGDGSGGVRAPGMAVHAIRVPPLQQRASARNSPTTTATGAASEGMARPANWYSLGVCESQSRTVHGLPASLPGASCSVSSECLLGVCGSDGTCTLADRSSWSSSTLPSAPPPSSSPTSNNNRSFDSANGGADLTSPILIAQLSIVVVATVVILAWSRSGVAWRLRARAALVAILARAQPKKNLVVRELALQPGDNRMLASYRPRRNGHHHHRGSRRFVVATVDGRIVEVAEEDWVEPLPRYSTMDVGSAPLPTLASASRQLSTSMGRFSSASMLDLPTVSRVVSPPPVPSLPLPAYQSLDRPPSRGSTPSGVSMQMPSPAVSRRGSASAAQLGALGLSPGVE
ncbi:hypothetical protein BC828DRAFT_138840 [Blastocladiella britannica]|nr:hypothetical protein BC828DRAFT_138840 [Blastocladiella britannica]